MAERQVVRAVGRVVSSGNCTGCGACALLLTGLRMQLSEDGFLRPKFDDPHGAGLDDADLVDRFERTCPGARVTARPASGASFHPTFGWYLDAWQASAADVEIRSAGSSGGVITALTTWMMQTGRAAAVLAARQDPTMPTRTATAHVNDTADLIETAGSRYAPVSNITSLPLVDISTSTIVGKPCEATGLRQYLEATGQPEAPVILSFFCAGTPSQLATDRLIRLLGNEPADVDALRYRGNGWPGQFAVQTTGGEEASMSYEQSWGKHLGRDLQTRCKLCPDGTGNDADIAVGDFWAADEDGYPVFEDGEGNSAVLVRTERGRELLQSAVSAGVVTIKHVDLDEVARVQPLQAKRMQQLGGRLLGRRLAGRSVPRYRGFGVLRLSVGAPLRTLRAAAGTWLRTVRSRTIGR